MVSKIKLTAAAMTAAVTMSAVAPAISVSADTVNNSTAVNAADSQTIHFYGEDVLDYLEKNNPESYNKIPEEVKQEVIMQDMLRQGSTYVKFNKDGSFRLYINSALVKTAKWAGGIAIAGAIAAAVASGGMGGVPAALGSAITGVINYLPDNRGAWFDFKRASIIRFGQQ